MGGQQFANGLFEKASVAKMEDGTYYLKLELTKGLVNIYSVTCNTFVDVSEHLGGTPTYRGVKDGTLGIYKSDGTLVTDGVLYELSDEGDVCANPDYESDPTNGYSRYVKTVYFPMEELVLNQEIYLTMYVNSQVMGVQFCNANDNSTATKYPAYIKLKGYKPETTVTAATCTQDGYKTVMRGDEVVSKRTTQKATGHTYENGVCSVCGHQLIDDCTFELSEDGTYYILKSYKGTNTKNIVLPNTYENKPVKEIYGDYTNANGAFANHTELVSVTLNDNLETIGMSAFYGCTALREITIPSSVKKIDNFAFKNCTALESVVFPESIDSSIGATYLGEEFTYQMQVGTNVINTTYYGDTFYGCASLKSLSLPQGLSVIPKQAFYGCTALSKINSNTDGVFDLTTIATVGDGAFKNCTSVTDVKLSTVTDSLAANILGGCTSLKTVNSDTDGFFDLTAYQTIGASAFVGSMVQKVKFSSQLSSLGNSAFSSCKQIVSVDWNNNAVSEFTLGSSAFNLCSSLTEITLPAGTLKIDNNTFCGTGLTSIKFGGNETLIGSSAFKECKALTSIDIPDSVTEIQTSAFESCVALTVVNITKDSQLNKIQGSAFKNCYELKEILIPAGVTAIDSKQSATTAFNGCRKLATVINLSDIKLTVGSAEYGNIALYANMVVIEANHEYVAAGDYTLYHDKTENSEKWYVTAYNGTSKTVALPESFTVGETTVSAYTIDDYAFYASGITSVTIPASVTAIGAYAFASCKNLTTVAFAKDCPITAISPYTFSGCVALAKIELPQTVTSIGTYAFNTNYQLSSVVMSGVTEIGAYAFRQCYSLKTITLPEKLTTIGDDAFNGCGGLKEICNLSSLSLTLGGGKSNNGGVAYYAYHIYNKDGSSNIVTDNNGFIFYYEAANGENAAVAKLIGYSGTTGSLTLPSSFKVGGTTVTEYEIGSYAFAYKSFTSLTVGNNVTAIGEYAFYSSSVMAVTLSTEVIKTIGDYAFYGCTNLKKFNSNTFFVCDLSGLTEIGSNAFNETGFQTVIVAASVTKLGSRAFAACPNLETITFEESETALDVSAGYTFYDCDALETFTLPSRITAISQYMLGACEKLNTVVIHDRVTAIAKSAFYNDTALISIVIPDSVKSIEKEIFKNSTVERVYYGGTASDFNQITITGNALSSVTVYYYSEEEPLFDGLYWHYVNGAVEVWEMV
jgi:hypothetical protein